MGLEKAELLKDAVNSVLFTADRPDIVMDRGEGMYIWDTEGKRYLDFVGGWAAASLGHSPDAVKQALNKQASALITASPAYYNRPMIELAKRLTEITCYDKVFFASSGSEANESAIKLARKYGAAFLNGANEIITLTNSFHGRTLATMSATGKEKWKDLFAPRVPGFKHVPLNDILACESSIDHKTCAIMLELVQGEGGVHAAEQDYLNQLRQLCDEKGILLIFDEIQTGMGRTGKMFAYQHYGIEADIMTLGKGIGGGFPLSAMLTKDKYNIFDPGDQGGTYSGQPLAMSVGQAVVNEVIRLDLSTNARIQGLYSIQALEQIQGKFQLSHIRGKGLLMAFDLPQPVGKELVQDCLHEGLLINAPNPDTVRLMPPLIVTGQEIDQMIQILSRSLARVLQPSVNET
ncbi:aspartate aminotransferase family protein [Paenibacillus sepulcri]|uniref:Aspartate aminotransferase family protein n=1 Tax=Paenibacillus sepulcri TaxID=359917 RepID=A0ABS7C4E7_9BACL|nr:aspartate aminotransferase family protein [Paenibacillus sepulcri]